MFDFPDNTARDRAVIASALKTMNDNMRREIGESNYINNIKNAMLESQDRNLRGFTEVAKLLMDIYDGSSKHHIAAYNDLLTKYNQVCKDKDRLEDELIMSKIENDKTNQRSKGDTIRIHNIAVPTLHDREKEDVVKTVTSYMADANITMHEDTIKSAFRPMKNGIKGNNVLFTLVRNTDKIKLLRQRKTKMTDNAEFRTKRPHSFITEDLTPLRQLIAYKLRQDKTRIKKSWSIDGKIKVLKVTQSENDKPVTIDSPFDLSEVGWTSDEIKQFNRDNLLHYHD